MSSPKAARDRRESRRLPAGSSEPWRNWTGNVVRSAPETVGATRFRPASLPELRAVLRHARKQGWIVRTTGQRHSASPVVVGDNRTSPETGPVVALVDMSCFADLGPDRDARIVHGPGPDEVTVCAGVREDELDAWLTARDLMLPTVTAGGFFSVGGMVCVDVHGGTVHAPIFAETVRAVSLLGADGRLRHIDPDTRRVDGWAPLQLARVSLGGLGIVTRVTLAVAPRPYATTLRGGVTRARIDGPDSFARTMCELVDQHTRVEVYFDPYADPRERDNLAALHWTVEEAPLERLPNEAVAVTDACELAERGVFGAELHPPERRRQNEAEEIAAQLAHSPAAAAAISAESLDGIASSAAEAQAAHAALWLSKSGTPMMFMAYYLRLPDLGPLGMQRVWAAIDAVARRVREPGPFHTVVPLEWRFVRGGDSALSGAYTTDPDTWFANLTLVGAAYETPASDYPPALLRFFADVERDWVALGGLPHHGKMHGFYDPSGPASHFGPPFQPGYMAAVRERRGPPLRAFAAYRRRLDPEGLFLHPYLARLLGEPET